MQAEAVGYEVKKPDSNNENVPLQYPSGKLAAVSRKRNQIKKLIAKEVSVSNQELVKEIFEELEEKFATLENEFKLQLEKNMTTSNKELLQDWFDVHYCEHMAYIPIINEYLQLKLSLRSTRPKETIQFGESASRWGGSNNSSIDSKTSSMKLKILERKSKLEAERRYQDVRFELEEQHRRNEAEYQRKVQQLSFAKEEQELKILSENLNANEENNFAGEGNSGVALNNFLSNSNKDLDFSSANKVIGCNFNPSSSYGKSPKIELDSFQSKNDKSNLGAILAKQNDITMLLVNNQQKSLLPKYEPKVFDGSDPIEFMDFILSFDKLISGNCIEDSDKYYYLSKYTKGHPNELVKSCHGIDFSRNYKLAMELLIKHYGCEFKIAEAIERKLDSWSQIKNEDGKAMHELSIFLTSCNNKMNNMNTLNHLNSPKVIIGIIQKLPFELRKKWRKKAHDKQESGYNVKFKDCVDFVCKEASILNTPLYSNIHDFKQKIIKHDDKKKSFTTAVDKELVKELHCLYCKKDNHNLDACFFFNKITYNEKIDFIKRKRACFACLNVGHSSKFCKNRLVCSQCSKRHPTILHIKKNQDKGINIHENENNKDLPEDISTDTIELEKKPAIEQKAFTIMNGESHSNTGTGEISRVICPSIPVMIRVKGGKNYIKTYLGLDTFCSDSFMDEGLLQKLGVKGRLVKISLTTMEKIKSNTTVQLLENLEIRSLNGQEQYIIDKVYTKNNWPFTIKDSPTPEDVVKCPGLQDVPFEFIKERIGLLVGLKQSDIIKPYEIVGDKNGAYASLHKFGWALNAVIPSINKDVSCHHLKIENEDIKEQIERYFSYDFVDQEAGKTGPSIEDLQWEIKVKASLKKNSDNHYEVCLPFRDDNVVLPYNYSQALQRLHGIKRKLRKEESFRKDYMEFMQQMIDNNFVEEVPKAELQQTFGKVYYICHHGIYHKVKKKLRVVFDCSAKFGDRSLNDRLLQGPDLANSLIGVLLRFRQKKFAIAGDIAKMFLQIRVPKDQVDFMRFLWFPGGRLDQDPVQFRMLVHVFGAVSSPSCANFVLQNLAHCDETMEEDVKEAILRSFYVDDLLQSVDEEEEAISLLREVRRTLHEGGFNLTSYISNSRKVLGSIPSVDLAKNVENLDLVHDNLPHDRALGVSWNVQSDSLGFALKVKETKFTRKGLLSTVASIYDPLGIGSPVIIPARKIFQESCKLKIEWDDELPEYLQKKWREWREELPLLSQYRLPRCYKDNLDCIRDVQLHIFADGSEKAYGSVAYLRYVDVNDSIKCSLVMAKSRLTPLNNSTLKTIPRIELNAAALSIKLRQLISQEVSITIHSEYFWSDSCTVLKYISSENKRFQRFVSNRVAFIRSHSLPSQWKYVPSEDNPADLISRGCSISSFLVHDQWKNGPKFLYHSEEFWPQFPNVKTILDNDPEVKTFKIMTIVTNEECITMNKLLHSSSDLYKLKVRVAWILKLKNCLLKREFKKNKLTVSELNRAEKEIIKFIQKREFHEEFKLLEKVQNHERKNQLKKKSPLSQLNPFIDEEGLIRVGGRLRHVLASYDIRHPIILPKNCHIAQQIIINIHRANGHLGREFVLSLLRQKYWILGANILVRKMLKNCLVCRKYQGKPAEQMMADLPEDRVTSNEPAFARTGVDYFGPFIVTRGRTSEKRYGVIFTCLSSRAMHLEVSHSLDTDSFINALRRCMARRGRIRKLRSDNGTNFVGANRELRDSLRKWNVSCLESWMKQENIEWQFQPPTASHFGGVWEREIRSIRKVLNALLSEQKIRLNDESLRTLMCEVESILNSRPLTNTSEDPNDLEPLTPNHLLILQSGTSFPPGLFSENDIYVRKRWKQVQYLANLFWSRWKREYLTLLQARKKWVNPRESLEVDDLVLLVDQQLPRGHWSLGRVLEVHKDSESRVRVAKVKVSKPIPGHNLKYSTTEIVRPISKLILLQKSD